MWADGRRAYRRLKDEIFARYGNGVRSKPKVERYVWVDKDTQRMLEFDAKRNTGLFVMRSSELTGRIKALYPSR